MDKRNSLGPILSVLVMTLGLAGMTGAIMHAPIFTMMFPGYIGMSFNSAFCFFISSIGILVYVYSPPLNPKIVLIPALIVTVLAGVSLAQYIFDVDIGIDSVFLKHFATDDKQYLVRMAQNTSMAFFLMGTSLMLANLSQHRMASLYIQLSMLTIVIVGIMAVVGYVLDLEFLYSWYQHTRMTIYTAFGFTMLAIGFTSAWTTTREYAALYKNNEDKRVLVICAVILTAIGLIAGLAGFSTSTKQNEEVLKDYLMETLHHRVELVQTAISRPIAEITEIKSNEVIKKALIDGRLSEDEKNKITRELFSQSYSAFIIKDAHNNIVLENGKFTNRADASFMINTIYHGELIWNEGFSLRLETPVTNNGKIIGNIIAEWPLDTVNQAMGTKEFYICGKDNSGQPFCMPKGERESVKGNFFLSGYLQQQLSEALMSDKRMLLQGESTKLVFMMAAVEPLKSLNLTFLYKENTENLYHPMRHQLEIAISILTVTIILGFLMLTWQVAPILRKVVSSEKLALESSIHLAAIVDHAAEGIATISDKYQIETFNENAAKTFGYQPAEVIGKNINILIAEKSGLQNSENVMDLLYADKEHEIFRKNIEVLAKKKNGETFPLEMSATSMNIDNKKKYVLIMRDISERKIAEEKLLESENRFRLAFDSAATGIALVALDGRWLRVNPALCRITGYSMSEMLKMRYQDISLPEDVKVSDTKLELLKNGSINSAELDKRYIRKDGAIIWVLVSIALVRDKAGVPLYTVAQIQEVTDKKKQAEELSYQAYYDALTGLVNRNQLEQSLDKSIAAALRSQKNFSVFFLDLDHFKEVNDNLGHDVGDELLKVVAERLKSSVRLTDVAARLGGDEFILVLNGVSTPDAAAGFAEKIMSVMSKPIIVRGHELNVGVSIGISFFPNDGADYDSLIKSADLALYRSKELGRNNYQFCTPEMNHEITDRMKFKAALETAITEKQFHLDYMPRQDLESEKIVAVEALLRWKSEEYGEVSPSKIIPIAEESGLIIPLSQWIINDACQQVKKWQKQSGVKLNLAVNVSKRQFKQKNFINNVLNAIQASGLAPYHLELEIAESLLMQDPEYSLNVIHALKDIGVQITMDNFGTGYSSLVYLHRFAVDRIKIDRDIVRQMTNNSEQASLIAAIISLAKNMGIRVAAEGIESKEQYELLQKYGCDEIQGYLISRPLQDDQVEKFITSKMENKIM